jgi:translation initiation factor IF-2
MSEGKSITLLKAAKELNIGIATAVDFLVKNGYDIESKPGTKLSADVYQVLLREFQGDKIIKEEANQIHIGKIRRDETPVEPVVSPRQRTDAEAEEILIKSTAMPSPVAPSTPKETPAPKPTAIEPVQESSIGGMKVVGKIDLDRLNRGVKPAVKEAPAAQQPAPEAPKEVAPVKEEAPKPVVEVKEEKPVVQEAPQVPVVEEKPKVEEKPAAPAPVASSSNTTPKVPTPAPAASTPASNNPPKVEGGDQVIRAKAARLSGPNVVGKIELPTRPSHSKDKPVASSSNASPGSAQDQKRKRKRKDRPVKPGATATPNAGGAPGGHRAKPDFKGNKGRHTPQVSKEEPTEKEIQDQIKATLARLSGAGKSGKFAQRAKLRRQKRDDYALSAEEAAMEQELLSKVLKVTEFVTANDLANLMGVSVTQIISTCMSLGLFVSINQRLDAETIAIVADEFGYEIEFVKPEDEETATLEEPDNEASMVPRAPIVTVMGHVDHGKTSLLDYVRKANVIAGEAGGITQHIGAYEVTLEDGRKITFLDTPGHEAFTAMRARGAKITDIVIIVIAADDSVMPQTKEAINHAQAAGVPIVFAFTKVDKPSANTDRIREQLSQMNILVEDWGGKFQSQEISSKTGLNVDLLLEKVLLEAELLDLKADPKKRAVGSVIEASLDKGRGIVTTVMIQSGTLRVGDPILAGSYSGKVKALNNERGQRVNEAGPSTPVQILGFSGAPTAGDKFYAMESETEARQVANKRLQLQREQGMRTQKHITLDEIGRRLAIGNFKELNIIVKGDVDGSIEALSDSLLKMSTEEIQVNVIHKSVGQISESDVLLASASDAIIVGFQVRPSSSARKLAEQEQIDIRLYSIIYDAIDELKSAMEGMLAPKFEEKIVANVEIRETFKISKVGTIAGCMVLDGKINRNHDIRIIRDGVVVYTGKLASLKRFKDDVKEVSAGYECGLNIQNFNDIKVGDIVEAYEQVEVKRKL